MNSPRKLGRGTTGSTFDKSKSSTLSERVMRDFVWDIVALNMHFEDIRRLWGERLGISAPQWMILMAISDLDHGQGVSVGDASVKIGVNSTAITTQTKILERSGFLTRRSSSEDARIVLMTLTEKARKEIANFSVKRDELMNTIFAGISDRTLREISEIQRRAEKAALQLELDSKT